MMRGSIAKGEKASGERDPIVSAQVVGSCLAASLHTKGIQDMIEGQNFG